jgi:phosphate transport system permease protein
MVTPSLVLALGLLLFLQRLWALRGMKKPISQTLGGASSFSLDHTAKWGQVAKLNGIVLLAFIGVAYLSLSWPTLLGPWLSVGILLVGWGLCWRYLTPHCHARAIGEGMVITLLRLSSLVAIFTTAAIILSLTFEAITFFRLVSPWDFLFGTHWSPQMALRSDQTGSSGSFGAIPLFAGTLMMTVIALSLALPLGLFSAIFLSQYATRRQRFWLKPMLEILSGIPTVVYGFFAVAVIAPALRDFGAYWNLTIMTESALVAGSVMGVMIIPLVSSLCDDVLSAVPKRLKEGALGLGATSQEVITGVVVPAALPGIISAFILAFSRAVGETMIVVMAAGIAANLTANPLEPVTTVTVQIVKLLIGDQEFDSPKTLSAYALGFVLFFITLIMNVIAMNRIKAYRARYD